MFAVILFYRVSVPLKKLSHAQSGALSSCEHLVMFSLDAQRRSQFRLEKLLNLALFFNYRLYKEFLVSAMKLKFGTNCSGLDMQPVLSKNDIPCAGKN